MRRGRILDLSVTKRSRMHIPHSVLIVGAVATVIAAAGCSSSGSSAGSTPTSSSKSAAVSSLTATVVPGVPTLAQLKLGFETSPPKTGPAPAKGKTVWWVSCGQSIPECSTPAAAAKKAATEVGWTFHVADGALDVNNGYPAAIRTAIAAHPDAIVVHGIDCAAIEQPLQEAKAAHIPVLGVEANDCPKSLFAGPMMYSSKAPTVQDYFRSWGNRWCGVPHRQGRWTRKSDFGGFAEPAHVAGPYRLQRDIL